MAVAARLVVVALILALTSPVSALDWKGYEGSARGFPALRDLDGRKLADGDFLQWIEGGRLHVRITYTTRGGTIEERAVFRQRPELVQERWSLRERRNGAVYREFAIDFPARVATAMKRDEGSPKTWREEIDVTAGRAFAGFGFTLALRAVRTRLLRGEHVALQTVGFTPGPRTVDVDVSFAGTDRIRMAGRSIQGERFVVHPKVPWFAKLFVNAPDAQIWLTTPAPPGFLRFEGPLAEPGEPAIRVDLLPGGGPSEAATPVATSGRR